MTVIKSNSLRERWFLRCSKCHPIVVCVSKTTSHIRLVAFRHVKDSLLRERGVGEFEGKRKDEIDWSGLAGDIYRNIPKGDALHALIARDCDAILITHDRDFQKLLDITKPKTPRDFI